MDIYDNSKVRRQDRLLDEARALELLATGEYGFLSLTRPDGSAYGIPISFVYDGASTIYLHCAPEGEKLRAIAANGKASFCVVGATRVAPGKFTTAYESVVAECKARVGLDADERMRALELLLKKYSPDHQEVGRKYAEKSFFRTEVIRLDVVSLSGKAKRIKFD